MNVLIILRGPIFDRIPSLKTLVHGLVIKGHRVTLITTNSPRFPKPSLEHPNFRVLLLKERSKKIGIPSSIKLIICAIKELIFTKYNFILGADCYSNILACRLSKLFHIPYVCFQLEYPTFPPLTSIEKKEIEAIASSQVLITHDQWHHEFLQSHMDLSHTDTYYLPNATYSSVTVQKSHMLQNRLGIHNRKLVLHSGGFSQVFRCKELAQATKNWGKDNYLLVFHISHYVKDDPYFNEIYNMDLNNVVFSLDPVNTDQLDKLVSSAYVGIALYSETHLGYRATYMGLAAGKIGNYLKCGIPVIATRLPSLQYLEDFHCGILIDSEDDILSALLHIDQQYDNYQKNAIDCYNTLWQPDKYVNPIIDRFLSLT